jgi:hypothetical protein
MYSSLNSLTVPENSSRDIWCMRIYALGIISLFFPPINMILADDAHNPSATVVTLYSDM